MNSTNRNEFWSYIGASDLIEVVESLGAAGTNSSAYEQGYDEALADILHAANLDKHLFSLNAVRQHIESWQGHVALNSSDDGYLQAVADVVESITQLISDRV